MNKYIKYTVLLVLAIFAGSCSISYKFNGAYIDYTKIKSISILDFPNNAELVYAPLANTFSESLRDKYSRQTRLLILRKSGDLNLEGEITGYQLSSVGVAADSYAAQSKLTLSVKVRFTNKKNPADDFEKSYTSSQSFDSNSLLADVQDEKVKLMVDDIVEQVFNDTVAKW